MNEEQNLTKFRKRDMFDWRNYEYFKKILTTKWILFCTILATNINCYKKIFYIKNCSALKTLIVSISVEKQNLER